VKTNAAIKVELVINAEIPRMLGLITLLGGKTVWPLTVPAQHRPRT
jgi:hypothetical protein